MLLAASTSTSGPSFSVDGWVAWVIVAGAVFGALGVIYKAVWPVVRMAIRFEERWPVLEQIAVDFKGNGHGTLGEQFKRIESTVNQIKADREVQVPMFLEDHEKLSELHAYAHDNVHALEGVVQEMQTRNDVTVKLTEKLSETVEELKSTRESIDASATTAASVVETARVAAAAVLKHAEEGK